MDHRLPRILTALTLLPALVACQPEIANETDTEESQATSPGALDNYQVEMLEQVNAARSTARTYGDTHYPAAPALTYQVSLGQAAEHHSQNMATYNFFSHTGSDGLQLRDRIEATGYAWRTIGENIAAGQKTVAQVMEGWLESEGHCKNIMNDQFEEFGVSRVDNEAADYERYWTQVFGAQR
ncbi:MAG: CAP domain-containing protein [Saccharospirillum sp.]